jgi:hypothetical protein
MRTVMVMMRSSNVELWPGVDWSWVLAHLVVSFGSCGYPSVHYFLSLCLHVRLCNDDVQKTTPRKSLLDTFISRIYIYAQAHFDRVLL